MTCGVFEPVENRSVLILSSWTLLKQKVLHQQSLTIFKSLSAFTACTKNIGDGMILKQLVSQFDYVNSKHLIIIINQIQT